MPTSREIVVGDLRAFTGDVVKSLSLEVHGELVKAPSQGGTPVDTGWARANWVPSIGTPFDGLSGTRPRSGTSTRAGGLAQSALARVAADYSIRQGPVFISNNVPYITRLNDGSSQQAPSGFVQEAIARALSSVLSSPPPSR